MDVKLFINIILKNINFR